ncbi:MAG: bifunctional DNA primase/polymerase [Actinomycetota bacterium]|nr:bifunctional DNA primase/polymerase [Actinomycetota bacterium]
MSGVRDAALDYAAARMPVLPLNGKIPRNQGGLTNASADVLKVAEWWRRWPDANVGIVTGSASGYVVLDVDAPAGLRSLADLEKRHGAIRTAQVLTGSGGRHLWFRCPDDPIRNSAGVIGEGLDVRGDGGYVVAPPSLHESGNVYKWTRELEHVAACPAWLLEDARERRNGSASPVGEVIAEGTRDGTLTSLAGTMRRRGMGEAEILGALRITNAERCRPPLPEPDLERIAASVARYAPAKSSAISDTLIAGAGPDRPLEKAAVSTRKLDGAEFIFSSPIETPAIWGSPGGEVLWAPGEALMIVGPDGVGKTTLAQQVVLARIGVLSELLALPIASAAGRVLYLAMDRPAQVARSFRRMVDEEQHADVLRDRLTVWKGPPAVSVLTSPGALADWIESEFGSVSDVVVDSLKDLAPKLSDDEAGSKVNLARQELLARGVEVLEVHHQRKEQRGQGKPKTLADVYGSRWLTAGAGSVVLLWGEPGDLVVELRHLKQPADEIGPLQVLHDHGLGTSRIHEHADLETVLGTSAHGMTVKDAARVLFESEEPRANEIEKARRKLDRLVERKIAERRYDPDGLARYFGWFEDA